MLPLLLALVLLRNSGAFLLSDRKIFTSNIRARVLPSLCRRTHPFLFDNRLSSFSLWAVLDPSCHSEERNDYGEKFIPDSSIEIQEFIHGLVASEECEGIEATTIGFTRDGRRRGIFAKDSFNPGEYIFAIPFTSTLLIHETYSGEEELSDIQLGFRLWTTILQPNEVGQCDEQRKDRWATYLACLPKQNSSQFTPTPEFWTEDAINAIEVPILVQEMKRRRREVSDIIRQYYPHLSSITQQMFYNDVLFAAWLVRSRGFTTVKASGLSGLENGGRISRTRTVLIPFMDFINHESNDSFVNAEIEVVDSKTDEESFFALACKRSISVGDEVLIQYGTGLENTLDLVSKYGFYSTDFINIQDESFFLDSFDGTNIWTSSIENDEQVLQTQILSEDMRRALELRLHLKRIEERIKSQFL